MLSLFTFMHWRRKWQPAPVFLPGEPQGWWSAPLKPRSGGVNQGYRAEYLRPMTESDFYSHVSLPGAGICLSSNYVCHPVLVAQSCPTLCNPMNYSPPGSSVHGILQARILDWVPIPFSRESSRPSDRTWVSHITGGFFTI